MKNIKNTPKIAAILLVLATICSCSKFVEVDAPYNRITEDNAYSDNATAISIVTTFYWDMSRTSLRTSTSGLTLISKFAGLSADEFTLNPATTNAKVLAFYRNKLTAISPSDGSSDLWASFYRYIGRLNIAIEGISNSTTLTPVVQRQLLGETKFLRAFCFFYLTNLFGDVPLALSTNYEVNTLLSKTPQLDIYKQIIKDLTEAKQLLSDKYYSSSILSTTSERIRPNKYTATALLSRAYLYSGDWPNAEIEATEIINQSGLYSLTALNGTFLKNSTESIWQLQPVNTGWNTEDALYFILPNTGPNANNNNVYLSPSLINNFENNDLRKTNWVKTLTVSNKTYLSPYKYKSATLNNPVTEYHTVFRLAEQYLIRSEARAHNNDLQGAIADLNIIRNRAGLGNTSATTKPDILVAILHEKQVELFSEWGHRWLDLKRTNTIDAVMNVVTPQKGGSWSSFSQLYPISQVELDKAINLTQNPGY